MNIEEFRKTNDHSKLYYRSYDTTRDILCEPEPITKSEVLALCAKKVLCNIYNTDSKKLSDVESIINNLFEVTENMQKTVSDFMERQLL